MSSGLLLKADLAQFSRHFAFVSFPEVDRRAISELYCVRTATLVDPQLILDIGLRRLTRARCDRADNSPVGGQPVVQLERV
jgi:hypothetical protein